MARRPQLLYCPHCGGTKRNTLQLHPHGVGNHRFFIVECVPARGGCGASITGKTKRQAAENWNRRYLWD